MPSAAASSSPQPLKVLSLSIVFPNPGEPTHGIFVRRRLEQVGKLAEVKVIAPVAAIDYSAADKRRLHNLKLPKTHQYGPLEVFYPRWIFPPLGTAINIVCLAARAWGTAFRLRRRFPFQLVDAHFAFPDGAAAALLAGVFHVPFMVTLRGNETFFARRPWRRATMSWSLRRAARVLAVSEDLRQFAISLGVDPARTRTVPNGIDVELFYPRNCCDVRTKFGIPLKSKFILSAGALVERKGHHRVVQALKLIRDRGVDATLVIAGGPGREGWFEEQIRAQVATLGLGSAVRMTGSVTPAEMAEWMSACDVLCLASDMEGWPNVVHEAQGCGAPVVAASVGGVPDMIPSDDYGYIVPRNDVDATAAALEKALAREWDRPLIARWAHARSWEKVAAEVYEQMRIAVG